MSYYAQHTRQVTDFAGIKGPSKIGSRCHLPAGRAVNELRIADARLASAAASLHCACLTDADILQRINDISATLTVTANLANPTTYCSTNDNELKRSLKSFHLRCMLRCAREGVFKGGYPFMFISPFDLKLKNNV